MVSGLISVLNKHASLVIRCTGRCFLSTVQSQENKVAAAGGSSFLDFHKIWPENEKQTLANDMKVIPEFVTEEEENKLLDELEPYLKRMRYEFDHWDDAIHGYRETERKNWYPENRRVIQRIADMAFGGNVMPYIHVLDLASDGVIKPHVDSTRYCGSTIAGISLLSDCVMRLVRTDEKKYQQQGDNNGDDYRTQPLMAHGESSFYADVLLQRRSLYVMRTFLLNASTFRLLSSGFVRRTFVTTKCIGRIKVLLKKPDDSRRNVEAFNKNVLKRIN